MTETEPTVEKVRDLADYLTLAWHCDSIGA